MPPSIAKALRDWNDISLPLAKREKALAKYNAWYEKDQQAKRDAAEAADATPVIPDSAWDSLVVELYPRYGKTGYASPAAAKVVADYLGGKRVTHGDRTKRAQKELGIPPIEMVEFYNEDGEVVAELGAGVLLQVLFSVGKDPVTNDAEVTLRGSIGKSWSLPAASRGVPFVAFFKARFKG
jgi:hypothetical protein